MRKFARIKTKLISCILLLAMSALFLASANHVQADQEYLSFDQYKAEHYINYSSYEYFMSDDFKMPYRTTVEKDRSSATFNSLLAAWEVATFSGSNVVEMANKRKGYYEAFLFDIIYTGTDAVNVTDAMNAGIKATQASVLSKVTKLMDEGYYKDIDVRKLTEESYAKLVSGLESCGEFNDIFSAVNNVGKYVQYANDIETLVYRMAKIEAICGQSKEYAEVLRDMSKNTTDETLAAACDEMASICDGVMNAKLMDAIMTGEEVVTNVSKWVTDKIWDYVIDSLGACGIGVTAGQAVGKWASGLLFSTDKTIETYYEMSALYNFDNAIRKVVKKYERQYSRYSSDSVEYAKKFNASVELMLKTQELGCDISIKDAEYKYEKGIANVFVSRFNGKKEAMASYKKSLQGIKKNIAFIYTFANGDLYNCYKDEYCSNVSDDLGMTDVATTDDGSSASKADEKQVTQELIRTAEACCKKEIKEPMKLTGNVTYYGDVYVSSDLNLNGYKCTVYGNLIQSSGTLTLNGGTLDVSGDYRMENENVDSTGNVSYSGCYAYLNMTNDSDRVNVGGTFENYTVYDSSYASDLHAGIMSVKGDFVCKYANDRFSTGGTHKVILNGTGVQKVQIADGKGFNELDIQNDNVVFIADTNMKGFKVNHDITLNVSQGKELRISGTLDLNGHTLYAPGNLVLTGDGVNVKGGNIVVDGNLNLSCDVNLGGGKLQVKGNLIQSDDTLTVAGGTVDVSGDYRMENENVDSTGNVSYSSGSAKLIMTNSADRVNVGGTFENYIWSSSSNISNLQAGVMSVKGDFICRDDCNGFYTGGTHKVILNGTGVQKVQIADSMGFNELDIQNDNVVFVADTDMKGFKANHDITLNVSQGKKLYISGTLDLNGHTLYAPGNLTLTGKGVNVKGGSIVVDGNLNLSCDVNLGGGKLQVKGNLIQSDDTLTVAGGTVDVSGDYRMENENVDSTGNVSYSGCSAKLNMTNTNDCVNVGGTFEFDASDGNLTDGIICIKKDFIIKSEYWRFNPTGNHTIKLDGDKVQKIQIDNSSNNKINNLYLTKDKSTGYNFVTDNCWNKLYLKTKVDKVTVSPELKDVCQGEQLQYSAQVSGVNSPSQDVTWSVTGAKSADTHIDENGLLSVAKDEAASNIVIKAVSAEDSSKTASQTVNITKRVPRVDAVRLSANTASMCPGDTHKFSAVVLGENDISQEVVWAVTGQQSADTKVAKDGTLTVGKDESADNISVVATSAVNNKVSASVKIQIVHIIIDSGVDQVAIVVKCGGSLSFEAHIVGINLSSDAVTWSVSNNTSKATSISHEGVLTVGEDEKAATLIVTATSVADPVKSASVNVKVEGSDNTKVVGYSVGLSDMISLNMYTYVPEKFLSDAGANAVFTLADGTVTQQPLSEFKKASYNGVNTVVINTKMVPAYITRSVTMKIVGSDGKESEGFTYSIYEYAKDYIKYATTETEYQKALPLVKAMLDYGAYSQLFFGVDASNLANYDRVSNLKLTEGNVEQTSCDSVFNAITNEETGTLGKEELIYQNISLICESETSMKLYFQNKNNLTLDQIKEKYAIKVYDSEGNVIPDDGCEMQVEGEKFWIKIKNLGPVKLSSDYTVEFTSDAGTQRGTVSPICYIKKAMKQDDMNLQNLCKAMYLYNKATLEYIGQ